MACTQLNHGFFIRHGIACDCAVTTRVVDGKVVDCTLREKRDALIDDMDRRLIERSNMITRLVTDS